MRPVYIFRAKTFDCIGESMLEPATGAIQTESKSTKRTTQGTTRFPLLGTWGLPGSLILCAFRFRATFNMQKVASGAKGTNPKCTIRTAYYISASGAGRPLLFKVVHKQTACAINTISGSVIGTTQLSFILRMAGRYMKIMEAMGKLAAFCILAGTSLSIAAAQFCLVAGGAEPGGHGRWRLNQGKQGFSQRKASTA